MRKITDIYKQYKIMPNLQEHQFRVACVAMQISGSLDIEVDLDSVITASLLHDMGNIIKFKLPYFPEFLEPEGLDYWTKIQNEYFEKYGNDEHHATTVIAGELGINEKAFEILDSVGFTKGQSNKESSDINRKIVCYADMRVKPHGVVSLVERLGDLRKRYAEERKEERGVSYINRPSTANDEQRKIFEESLHEIEKQIFSHSNIKPEEINDESVKKYIENLKDFEF